MFLKKSPLMALFLFSMVLITGCAAPRSVSLTPEATAKKQWRLGGEVPVHLPTETVSSLSDGLENGIKDLVAHDTTPITAKTLNGYTKVLFAYALDPIGPRTDLFVRYGAFNRFDLGYRFASGNHAFDMRYQFMGSLAGDSVAIQKWKGSIDLQYCQQSFDLPSVAGLDKLQSLLQFEFKRKDILIPLIIGIEIGERGKYGSYAFGAAWDYSIISYGSDIIKLVQKFDDGTTGKFVNLDGDAHYSSYGSFANLRLGFSRVFLLGAFSAYYQNYGDYKLFGNESIHLSGWTFIPSLGLEIRI